MQPKHIPYFITLVTLMTAATDPSHATQLDTSTEFQEKKQPVSLSNVSPKTTLLHKAVKAGKDLQTIDFLANEMADTLNAIDEHNKTALDYAKGNGPIYRLLVTKGAYRKVDLALFDIARHGKPKDLEYALQQGANLDIKDGSGHTLAQIAKQASNFEMAYTFQERAYEAKLEAQKHVLLTQPKQPLPSHQALMELFSQQLQVPYSAVYSGIAAEQALVRHAGITRQQTGAMFRRDPKTNHTWFQFRMDPQEFSQWIDFYYESYPGLIKSIKNLPEGWVRITMDTRILYHQVLPKLSY